MTLSFLATFDLNMDSYSLLTVAKGKGRSQLASFSYKIKVEQEVGQTMNFVILEKMHIFLFYK